MDSFQIHRRVITDYCGYIERFVNIRDEEVLGVVQKALSEGRLWPEPLIQFNPSYEITGDLDSVVTSEQVHPLLEDIFKGCRLYRQHVAALRVGIKASDFVVTSGTDSGKSLTYIGTIFNQLLKNPQPGKVTVVIVYSMNGLINSQTEEIDPYKKEFEKNTGQPLPIRFGKYTGQENDDQRKELQVSPPDILQLRDLHVQMDQAVLATYGWYQAIDADPAIDLRHDFYEVDYLPENDRVRYDIHSDASKEILKRLLQLNHKLYAEEEAKGLQKKKPG